MPLLLHLAAPTLSPAPPPQTDLQTCKPRRGRPLGPVVQDGHTHLSNTNVAPKPASQPASRPLLLHAACLLPPPCLRQGHLRPTCRPFAEPGSPRRGQTQSARSKMGCTPSRPVEVVPSRADPEPQPKLTLGKRASLLKQRQVRETERPRAGPPPPAPAPPAAPPPRGLPRARARACRCSRKPRAVAAPAPHPAAGLHHRPAAPRTAPQLPPCRARLGLAQGGAPPRSPRPQPADLVVTSVP